MSERDDCRELLIEIRREVGRLNSNALHVLNQIHRLDGFLYDLIKNEDHEVPL